MVTARATPNFSLVAHIRRLSAAGSELYIRIDRADISRLGLRHLEAIEMDLGRVRVIGIVKTSGSCPWLGPTPGSSNAFITAALRGVGFQHGIDVSATVRSSGAESESSRAINVAPAREVARRPDQMAPQRSAHPAIAIDDAFIREWHPRYNLTENDEPEYERLAAAVAQDMASGGTISKETFLRIWNWKGAMRVIRHVRIEEYDTLYAPAFRRAASAAPEQKLDALLGPGMKLPGVEVATGSTVVHFMHPRIMPIIDVRTVEVLFKAGLISTDRKDLAHYEEFRQAIEGIRRRCPSWSLRQIDRALFAYHKQYLDVGHAGDCQ